MLEARFVKVMYSHPRRSGHLLPSSVRATASTTKTYHSEVGDISLKHLMYVSHQTYHDVGGWPEQMVSEFQHLWARFWEGYVVRGSEKVGASAQVIVEEPRAESDVLGVEAERQTGLRG